MWQQIFSWLCRTGQRTCDRRRSHRPSHRTFHCPPLCRNHPHRPACYALRGRHASRRRLGKSLFLGQWKLPLGLPFLLVFGAASGIYLGFWVMALAEMADIFPIFARRIKFTQGLPFVILSVGMGKLPVLCCTTGAVFPEPHTFRLYTQSSKKSKHRKDGFFMATSQQQKSKSNTRTM